MPDRNKPGRPPLHDVPATALISVRVTPAERLALQRVASENRMGVSGIIREAVNSFVADYDDRLPFVRTKP